MELIGAIDQGTQSTRFFLFNEQAEPVVCRHVEFPQHYPRAGWCEHDPMQIWDSVTTCIAKALQDAREKVGAFTVKAVGITNQRETTMAWDRNTGKPLHHAIVWMDNRTAAICQRMKEELGGQDYFRPTTGLPISTYFSSFKFLWLVENVPAVADAVADGSCMFGTMDSWLVYLLTGGCDGGIHVTDVSNASRTNLMDLSTCQWHPPYLELFRVPPAALPRIVSNSEVYGTVKGGPLDGVPIAGCLGDQMAAMLGQRCAPGEAKNTYGTGCFMLLNTGPEVVGSQHGLLTTVAFQLGPDAPVQYALEGSVAVAGMGVSWLRDNLGVISTASETEVLARSVPDAGGVYFVPAFQGLLAPHWQNDARGVILGLTSFSTRAHICRAMLEAICFQTREVLDAMNADVAGHTESGGEDLDRGAGAAELEAASGDGMLSPSRTLSPSGMVSPSGTLSPSGSAVVEGLRLLRVDGGATQNNLLMQLQADILQVPVVRPNFQETTSLGAALAAGLAVGMWTHEQLFTHHAGGVAHQRVFRAAVPRKDTERRYKHWKKAVERSLDLADLAQ